MPHSTPPTSDRSQDNDADGHHSNVPSIRKAAMVSSAAAAEKASESQSSSSSPESVAHRDSLIPPPNSTVAHALQSITNGNHSSSHHAGSASEASRSAASTAPNSPHLMPLKSSGTSTPRTRNPPTTLNVPGMTSSRVSPDGRIADQDVGSKLVIIMVGLPARGKSYITKKMVRYLRWLQHNAEIFNVGNKRRKAAGADPVTSEHCETHAAHGRRRTLSTLGDISKLKGGAKDGPEHAAHILLNGAPPEDKDENLLGKPALGDGAPADSNEPMEQNAEFFDPKNEEASRIREKVALETLEELLDYLLLGGGSVGILDATNSTVGRRQLLYDHIKKREPKLGIVFIESVCEDKEILEANMRLKLSGPDYIGKDPVKSLEDFRKRVAAYEGAYVPLGAYEEANDLPYIKMIDVGRKMVTYQCKSFLTSNLAHYLNTFNLAPRQIWITRHGQSCDNLVGKLGGDSNVTAEGRTYARVLYNFVTKKRQEWLLDQKHKILSSTFPPQPGDNTPPYPEQRLGELDQKNFCVWTSRLQRSISTAADFTEDEDYDVKHWADLNELNAGDFEGSTYETIQRDCPDEYRKRSENKLTYKYPGVGGEGYLQVIARLRDMVREMERIKDHILVIGHRSICRVLLAYFMNIEREKVAELNVPLGDLFVIEPKPYGHETHAYRYNVERETFDELLDWKPENETEKGN